MVSPKIAVQTVSFVDEYCEAYKNIFSEVRTFENFKFLHLGIMSQIQRKSLTGIAKAIGLKDSQPLNNFLKNSPWDVQALRLKRLMWLKDKLNNRSFVLVINEIGDKKKGNTTAYVAKQYICQLAKTENAIVSINAYGVLDGITFPLIFKVFKPQNSLSLNEEYQTKPQLAIAIIQQLKEMGFKFDLVIADNIYTKNSEFLELSSKLSIHLLLPNQDCNSDTFVRSHNRVNLDIIELHKLAQTNQRSQADLEPKNRGMFKEQTEIKSSTSSNSTWHIKGEREASESYKMGEIYNFVNWVEYGFQQVKQELGWGDFRVTNYRAIERWWEIIFSVYWMISLHSDVFQTGKQNQSQKSILSQQQPTSISSLEEQMIWYHRLDNLQSIIHL
ncbi:transposase [Merismopedia glauca]|nr:transposase [Merismopedia glauca]